jgi:D-sedoheptulose 7-phosphate isomerase
VEKATEIVGLRAVMAQRYAEELATCAGALARAFNAGGRLFTFGNGGSSTDAQAVAQLFLDPGSGARALPALALTADVAVLSALANDVGFEVVFARPPAAFARPGDVAVGLSTSGGSTNVLRGFE